MAQIEEFSVVHSPKIFWGYSMPSGRQTAINNKRLLMNLLFIGRKASDCWQGYH